MTYNLANMTPSEKALVPGNWIELAADPDLSRVRRVWVRNHEIDVIRPGSFTDAPVSSPGQSTAVLPGVAYVMLDGRQVTRELGDIVAVELS
jgi:hypothetical protein